MSEADKSGCAEVPFIEQLRSLPIDYRVAREIQWASDGTPTGHQFIPVGFMFHCAADELLAAQERAEKAEAACQECKRMRRGEIDRLNTAESALSSSRAREAMLSAALTLGIEYLTPRIAGTNGHGETVVLPAMRAALSSTETKP